MMIVWCKNIKNIDFDSEFEMKFSCLKSHSVFFILRGDSKKPMSQCDIPKNEKFLILSYKVWEVASYVFYDPWYI